jgi:hypothetical protein
MFLDDFFNGSRCRRLLFLADINDIGDKLPIGTVDNATKLFMAVFDAGRVSLETRFDWKQPKLEPRLSALSETKRLFRLFRLFHLYTETESFGVSIEPKQQKSNRNSLIESIFWYFKENLGLFRFVSVCFETVLFVSVVSI